MDDLPIALRRPRRASTAPTEEQSLISPSKASASHDPSHQKPKTPRKSKKAVRFSDPRASSGLTPLIRRAALATPRRRQSTPARSSPAATPSSSRYGAPQVLQSHQKNEDCLHSTAEGRVSRLTRRNTFRNFINKLDFQSRKREQTAKSQIADLKEHVKTRDREIYELQNATIVIDTDRIWELEKEVDNLRQELNRRETAQRTIVPHLDDDTADDAYEWTLAARDPYAGEYTGLHEDDDDGADMTLDNEQFGDETARHLVCSTPSRARASASFPTPPATSPTVATEPNTPCGSDFDPMEVAPRNQAPATTTAGVQTSFRDHEKEDWEMEILSLRGEVDKLSETLTRHKDIDARMATKVSAHQAATDEMSDELEAKVDALLNTLAAQAADSEKTLESLKGLGFPGSSSTEIIHSLTSHLRMARLELEYLTPGEITLPLTSHGAEILDLLLTKLRELATKGKEDEAAIDEYHDIEQSLRRQLDARVSAMDDLEAEVKTLKNLHEQKESKVAELEVGIQRLKGAVEGYTRDMSELERLAEQLEREGRDKEATLHATKESHRQTLSLNEGSISELEQALSAAVGKAAALESQLVELSSSHEVKLAEAAASHEKDTSALQDAQTSHVVALNKRHGKALALRDARVTELREEIDRVNASLREAHETIRRLRVERGKLSTQVDGLRETNSALLEEQAQWEKKAEEEKRKASEAVSSMRAQLEKVVAESRETFESPRGKVRPRVEDGQLQASEHAVAQSDDLAKGEFLKSGLAKRSSKRLRRRYDSGLGFLDDEEVDMF